MIWRKGFINQLILIDTEITDTVMSDSDTEADTLIDADAADTAGTDTVSDTDPDPDIIPTIFFWCDLNIFIFWW